ncbi:hypothetical protein [Paenibacillus massiliensis]|uniref:hypothetical protein n=1 Tax=Paenibacillus massiliensis TaxID=225917 RepID=UPI000418AAEB|nr:hypothetical protein [Paenibacillus massiliensis]
MSYSYEIFDLFKKVAVERGLDQSFIDSILKDIYVEPTKSFRTVQFGLKVSGLKFPLEFHSDKESKIFEIRGINTRYKTTSLIIMGILMGCDWSSQTIFLNNYKLESQIEEVKGYFFNNAISIEMYLKNEEEELLFLKRENYLEVIVSGEVEFKRSLKNYELDMQEYQLFTSKLFKVQFISKGRDFVTQVHYEILESITSSFDYLTRSGREVLSNFMSKKQRKIYSKSLKEYENELVLLLSLKKLINEFKKNNPEINDLDIYEQIDKFKENEERLRQLQEEEDGVNSKLKELVHQRHGLLEEGLNDGNDVIKSPSHWENPVRNLEQILESVEKLEGTDLVPMYIELQGNSVINVNDSNDFKKFIELINTRQTGAANYFDYREKYVRLSEINKFIEMERANASVIAYEINRLVGLIRKTEELTISVNTDVKSLLPKIKSIRMLMSKGNISETGDIEEISKQTEQRIEEINYIISDIKSANSKDEYIPYEILNSILFEFNSVKSLLVEKSGNKSNFNSSIKETAEESFLYTEVVELFNNLMKERCKYYYQVTDDIVTSIELKSYDFESRMLTTLDGDEISARYGLSGGIDSAMTVRSLASPNTDSKYGTVILVDEWGDVSDKLAKEVYNTLYEINQLSFGLFVEVSEEEQAVVHCIDG